MQISRWPGLTAGQLWDQIIALEALADAGVRETVADGVTTRFATLDDMRSRIAEMRAEYDRRSIELEGGIPAAHPTAARRATLAVRDGGRRMTLARATRRILSFFSTDAAKDSPGRRPPVSTRLRSEDDEYTADTRRKAVAQTRDTVGDIEVATGQPGGLL